MQGNAYIDILNVLPYSIEYFEGLSNETNNSNINYSV